MEIDLNRLRDLLEAKQWQAADEETAACLLQAMPGKKLWLEPEALENFPCRVLLNVDQLWVQYSQGRFGFSVQAQIWRSCGSPTNYLSPEWEAFGVTVGWRRSEPSLNEQTTPSPAPEFRWNQAILDKRSGWLAYSQLRFDESAPIGHLPVTGDRVANRGGPLLIAGRHPFHDSRGNGERARRPILFSRVETCRMQSGGHQG